MARFVVDLGSVKLTDEEQNGIASAVHAAVIGHLATLSNPGLHDATKTLNHAGMLVAPSRPVAKTAGTGAPKAASGRAARKSG